MASATYKYYQGDVYDPVNKVYNPKEARREQNLFIEEYYCSTDTRIYIEDLEQTEIAYINYALQEQLKPLYGYASNTFDDVAVGNRIVTGMLKVPIKNPEAQTDISEIFINGNGLEDIKEYNEEQEELKKTIEWIDNNKGSNDDNTNNPTDKEQSSGNKPVQPPYASGGEPNPDSGKEIDGEPTNTGERLEYLEKLQELGYKVSASSTPQEFSKALEKFQQDNNKILSEVNGFLTQETKMQIDLLYGAKKDELGETKTIPKNTPVMNGPSSDSGVIFKLEKDTKCYVLDESADGYVCVQIKSGEHAGDKGFVKKEVLE